MGRGARWACKQLNGVCVGPFAQPQQGHAKGRPGPLSMCSLPPSHSRTPLAATHAADGRGSGWGRLGLGWRWARRRGRGRAEQLRVGMCKRGGVLDPKNRLGGQGGRVCMVLLVVLLWEVGEDLVKLREGVCVGLHSTPL